MLIPRKEKGQLEIYRCKLGIHAWVTEHWWELRQRPRNTLTRKEVGRELNIIRNIVPEPIVESVVKKKKNENKESRSSKRQMD